MLKTLVIQNYSLIEELNIDFSTGFSVITGETGAGKSIMLGALGLLLGNRADSKAIMNGAPKCIIEGLFSLKGLNLESFFQTNDFEFDSSDCIIRREIYASGKSRAFINDTPAQLSQLKELGEQLIDIHSQHKNLLLGKENFQIEVLDTIAQNVNLLSEYKKEYNSYQLLKKEYQDTLNSAQKSQEEEDFLTFQFNQLNELNLIAGEQEELEEEMEVLSHAEEIKNTLYAGSNIMQEDDSSILSMIKNLNNTLKSIQNYYPLVSEWLQRIESTYIELKDIACELEDKNEQIDFNPERLSFIDDRLSSIYSLEKKHKKESVEELIELKDQLEKQLDLISNYDERIQELKGQVNKQKAILEKLSEKITESRTKSASKLKKELIEILSKLGMPNVQFEVSFNKLPSFKATGKDDVQFLFNANKGGKLQDLAQVASGGEISRVMLALKSIIATTQKLPTIIFDEIDTGVSGSIADKMSTIMTEMSKSNETQVISITHLPQIAAKGNTQYRVYKEDKANKTVSRIIKLTLEERIQEIAHMLSGENLTDAAVSNAKELLKQNLNA